MNPDMDTSWTCQRTLAFATSFPGRYPDPGGVCRSQLGRRWPVRDLAVGGSIWRA